MKLSIVQKPVIGQGKYFNGCSSCERLKYSTIIVYVGGLCFCRSFVARHSCCEHPDRFAHIHNLRVANESVEDVSLRSMPHEVEPELSIDEEPVTSGLEPDFK